MTFKIRGYSPGDIARGLYVRLFDRQFLLERDPNYRAVFEKLKEAGFLDAMEGKRIVEIGPRHGLDSIKLATLKPSELVMIDLPNQDTSWMAEVVGTKKLIHGDMMYMSAEEFAALGTFDMVWCTGVLYHNSEQLKMIRKLFHLAKVGGRVVIESAIITDPRLQNQNVVQVHWPRPFRKVVSVIHLPSTLAIKSWMEMVGFEDVQVRHILSKTIARKRAVLTGVKKAEGAGFKPHTYYLPDSTVVLGDAT